LAASSASIWPALRSARARDTIAPVATAEHHEQQRPSDLLRQLQRERDALDELESSAHGLTASELRERLAACRNRVEALGRRLSQ